jgi:hypothetical protein
MKPESALLTPLFMLWIVPCAQKLALTRNCHGKFPEAHQQLQQLAQGFRRKERERQGELLAIPSQ